MKRLAFTLGIAALAATPGALAQDNWVNPAAGDWSNAANWSGGVPSGGQANINNGGTAIVSTVVPSVLEAWTGNSGVAGNIVVTNGGTLPVSDWLVVGRTGSGGNTPLSTLIVSGNGIINKSGSGFIVGDGTFCSGQVIVKDGALVHISGGWNGIGNGNGGEGWLTLQDNAVYTLDAQDWNIGDYGTGRGHAYIKDNATLNCSRFFVGKNDNAVGALWQSGGAIVGTGGNANEWTFGGDNGAGSLNAFGFYNLTAGTFSNPFNFQVGRYGKGVIYQSGGTITLGSWASIGRYPTAIGIVYITGGQMNHTGTGTHLMVAENGSRGELTLAGTGSLSCNASFVIGNGNNGTGIVNLNSGNLRVPMIERWTPTTGYLNLNGTRIQVTANSVTFMGGLSEACVYSGNAIIDTAGFDATVAQALVAPSGDGVRSIPVTDGGAGYMAAPIVQIDASGFGSGATAIAQINPTAGTVTNIVVTCSGYNYSTAPNVTFIGGGPTTPATPGVPTLGPVTSGGLVKNGLGTLTLSGASTYTGATVVNAGRLVTSTDPTGAGSYTVADNATLGVKLASASAQLPMASLTLASSTAAALDIDLVDFGNSSAAPLYVAGALAVNGAITVNFATAAPQLGQFPLIKYGSRTGAGSFILGPLPVGVVATLVTNAGNSSIDLNVTAVAAPRWDGQAGGNWDVGLTTNWVESSTGLPAYFAQGNAVTFNDVAMGTTNVNLVATVNPAKVIVNNSNLLYTISGTGKISGATGLTKQGPGTLALQTVNDYTGITRIEGGTVVVTNLVNGGLPSAIGAASASPTNVVFAGGALSYAGPAVAINRGYTVQAANSAIDVQSDLTLSGRVAASTSSGFRKTGPAKLTYTGVGVNELSGGGFPGYNLLAGTLVFDGSAGGQTNHNQNELWVGGSPTNAAAMVLTNTTLNVDSWVAVSRGNGTIGNVSSVSLFNSVLRSGAFSMGYDGGIAGNLAQQFLTLNGTSALTNNGDMNVGESGGSSASILLNDSSALYSNWRVHLGWHNNGIAALTLANSSRMAVNAWFSVANEGGTGTLTVKNNSSLWVLWDLNITDVNAGDGTFNLQDNAVASANNFFIGKGAGSSGIVNQTGGSAIGLLSGNEFQIGFHGAGTWNLSGGTIQASNHWFVIGRYTDGPGTVNATGGTIRHTSTSGKLFRVGEEGTGVLNLSSAGDIQTFADAITVGSGASGNGTINLDGGTLLARRIIGGSGTSVVNFNGGLLRVGPNPNADFMSGLSAAFVLAGGARIDTAGNTVSIAQSLLDGGTGGGLTKLGSGTLALDGFNGYSGTTTVSAGALGGNGVLSGPVVVSAAGTLSPGSSIGTLTVNSTLSLAGTTLMEVSKSGNTNDSVLGVSTLTYGGTLVLKNLGGQLVAGDSYILFGATSYGGTFTSVVSDTPGQTVTWDTSKLATDGSVKVLTAVTLPVKLTSTVSSGSLTLAWPTNQIGWALQTQVNPLTTGISTNWTLVPGSTATNQMSFPINSANGSTFFRLFFP